MAKTEIGIDDAELDAMMAELEAETASMTKAPVVKVVAPEPEPEPVKVSEPEPVPIKAPEPEPIPTPSPVLTAKLVMPTPEPEQEPEVQVSNEVVEKLAEIAKPKAPASLLFFIDVEKFNDETKVSEVNLDNCMMQQASLRASYGANSARAEAQADRTKIQVEIAEAKLYDKHRKLLLADPTIKVTEKMVENAVRLDEAYGRIHNRLIEAESIAALNKHIVESLKDRRDMIIQLGADRRDEYKGQARIMAKEDERADLQARALRAASH